MSGLTHNEVRVLRKLDEARSEHKWARRLLTAWFLFATLWLGVIITLVSITIATTGVRDMAGWNFFGLIWFMFGGWGVGAAGSVAWPAYFETENNVRRARYAPEDALMERS